MFFDPMITPTPTHIVPNVPTTVLVNHGEKSEKFNGTEFKRWQQKILFYLTALNLREEACW